MGLSLKQAASSTVGKILAGAAIFAAGHMIDKSAEAAEVTTIVHDDVALCIGADMGGFGSVLKMGSKGTLTDGKSTAFEPTSKEINNFQMYNPYSYRTELHRNFAITYYPPNNDITEGHHLYNTDTGNEEFVINTTNYPDYAPGMDVHFVKGATPDQDQMVFLGNPTYVYKSPFDANGNVKAECKAGPVAFDFKYTPTFSNGDSRALGNSIYYLGKSKNKSAVVTKVTIGLAAMTVDSAITVEGLYINYWGNTEESFISYKDANSKETTYLGIKGVDGRHLFNVDNLTDHKQTNASDIVVVDPAGRYEFKKANDATGNTAIFLTDTQANPVISKSIIPANIYSLNGSVAYLDNYSTPRWVVYSSKAMTNGTDDVYLIELLDVATMNVKVTKMPLAVFTQKFPGGTVNCVPLPNPKVTVTKSGGTPDAGGDTGATEGVVEKDQDAGATETDGGSTPDAAAEVVDAPDVMSSDADAAIDAWVDGNSDMQDIFAADETSTPDVGPDVGPDQADAAVDGVVIPPDMSTGDAPLDGSLPPDAQNTKDATMADADDALAQGDDGSGTPPPDNGAKPGLDAAGSPDSSGKPVISAPTPKDTGCNAGGNNNNLSPLAIAAATFLAVGLARKREEES